MKEIQSVVDDHKANMKPGEPQLNYCDKSVMVRLCHLRGDDCLLIGHSCILDNAQLYIYTIERYIIMLQKVEYSKQILIRRTHITRTNFVGPLISLS